MNELLESVINNIEIFLLDKGYLKIGKKDFVRKTKENGRQEKISFSHRRGRGDYSDWIYIEITCGIYFSKVNKLDKRIIQDFLNPYPIISGSIGYYKKSDKGYISIPIDSYQQIDEVVEIMIKNIEKGAFNLFNTYPTLKSILLGVENNDEWLKDYHKPLEFRGAIRLSAMYLLEKGKDFAIFWFEQNAPNNENKMQIIKLMKEKW